MLFFIFRITRRYINNLLTPRRDDATKINVYNFLCAVAGNFIKNLPGLMHQHPGGTELISEHGKAIGKMCFLHFYKDLTTF